MGRGAAMLKTGQAGYTLVETLCAMAVAGLVLMTAMRFLPLLQRQSLNNIQQMRLTQHLNHGMLQIEKDLRRAGMCRPACRRPSVVIAERHGEPRHSCLLATYAFYPPQSVAPSGALSNETFGYRLRQGVLESQRGVVHCHGAGWAKMHDPRQWRVRELRFEFLAENAFRVVLVGETRGRPVARQRISRIVAARNGPA